MRSLMLVTALAMSACAAAPPAAGPAAPGTCRPDGLSRFVGQPATQELGAAMLRESGARIIRWVSHGMMITMEFSPERLTVHLTPDNRVERANCG